MESSQGGVSRFFLLAFALTWGLQLPGVFAQWGLLPGAPPFYLALAGLGMLGPALAATILTAREGGKPALGELYRGLLKWKVHPAWYVVTLLIPGALLTFFLVLLNQAGRSGPIEYLASGGLLASGIFISVAEEIGWRGYALPRLCRSHGPIVASSCLGVVWYVWHIPMFLGLGTPLNLVLVMLLYFLGASLFLTWVVRGTGHSLLLAVAAHWGAHLNNSNRALPGEVVPLLVHAIVYAALGLFATYWFMGRDERTRRRATGPMSIPW